MSGTNGNMPSGLAEIVAGIEALIAEKQQIVDSIEAVLVDERKELRQLKAVQKAADPESVKPVKRVTPRQGEEELKIMLTKLRKLPERDWADPEIAGSFASRTLQGFGVTDSTADRMIKALREREQVRLVGERSLQKGARPSKIYVLNDE